MISKFRYVVSMLILMLTLFATTLTAAAAGLDATSVGIVVHDLPTLEIIDTDINKGVVYLAAPETDKAINANLRAIVTVTTANGDVLETVEVKVADPADIRVTFKTTLKPSFIITAVLKNHDIQSNETATATATVLDLVPPVVNSIEFTEVQDTGMLNSLLRLFNKNVYNTKMRTTIIATDETELGEIYYCITPSAYIPESATWMETTGIIDFDSEITGTIHAKAVDKSKNSSAIVSKPILIDKTPPIISFELAPRDNEYEPAVIRLHVKEDENAIAISGIDYIVNPLGEITTAINPLNEYLEFVATKNDNYSFSVLDNAGNPQAIYVKIDCITPITKLDWENNQVVADAVQQATSKPNIEAVTYTDLQKITYIDLSSNGLTSIPDILGFAKNIEHLDLRGNEFEQVPACVYKLKKLKQLDLSNNNINEISGDIIKLTALENLDVSLNYLIDYEPPSIVAKYRNVGNFTNNAQPDQYTFKLLQPDATKEYIGNTTQYATQWTFDGQLVNGGIEKHRKALFIENYPAYHSYRPLLYKYNVSNGTTKTATADYVQVYLPQAGVTSVSLEVGR